MPVPFLGSSHAAQIFGSAGAQQAMQLRYLRLTRTELTVLLRKIACELPNLAEGSVSCATRTRSARAAGLPAALTASGGWPDQRARRGSIPYRGDADVPSPPPRCDRLGRSTRELLELIERIRRPAPR